MISIKKHNIDNTKFILAEDMKKYVKIILDEFGDVIPEEKQLFLRKIDDYNERILLSDYGTISMFANNENIFMPIGAYKIFRFMKLMPGYGINKNHQMYKEGQIINTNTYYDYIKHVLISGMSVEEFFRDSLLHETMHFCGSGGSNALLEGFTELKTREIAQKYNLKASRCGYPKEVDIANRFQQIVGVDVANQIIFAQNDREIDNILREICGEDIAKLFSEISSLMNKELNSKYNHSKFGGIFGPVKKAKAYSQINYSDIYQILSDYEKENKQRNQFIKRIKQENINTIPLQNLGIDVIQEKEEQNKE